MPLVMSVIDDFYKTLEKLKKSFQGVATDYTLPEHWGLSKDKGVCVCVCGCGCALTRNFVP